jgi:hypothetical protein
MSDDAVRLRRPSRPAWLGAGAILLASAAPAVAAPIPGEILLDARLRSETVQQDGFARDAEALTLRTRLGYRTPAWRGFRALVEGSSNLALAERYDSTANGRTRSPVVADPGSTELNRLQASWSGAAGDVVVGRQRLILGNSRFVGNSGFRQNEQTFDAARAGVRPAKDLAFTYAYVSHVHRVFGDGAPQGGWSSDTHLFQADLQTRVGQLTAYGYLMAFANAPAQSNATFGVRFAGVRPVRPGLSVTYEAEYARQTDYRNSPLPFALDYLDLGLGLKSSDGWVSLNLERLDGDGRRGFVTPLATLHAFQGWADVFAGAPAEGLRDVQLKAGRAFALGSTRRKLRIAAEAHDFTATHGAGRYGRELDLLASWPVDRNLTVELKGAAFDGARPGFADRAKVWVSLQYRS